jgi:hypothetical protein
VTEDERFEAIFERNHGTESRAYYQAEERSLDSLSCRVLNACAPERGVWSDEAQTVVNVNTARLLKGRFVGKVRRVGGRFVGK